MKLSELSDDQLHYLADTEPLSLVVCRPDLLAELRPKWLATHQPGLLAVIRPYALAKHRPDMFKELCPGWSPDPELPPKVEELLTKKAYDQ